MTSLFYLTVWFSVQFVVRGLKGTDLYCYDCKSYFKDKYEPDACIANLTANYDPRRCQRHDQFCMIQSIKVNRVISTFERDCVSVCAEGCILKGLAVATETCTYCCDSSIGCNQGNSGSKLTLGLSVFYVHSTCLGYVVCSLFFFISSK